MKILVWHVHGSWLTALVQGPQVVPVGVGFADFDSWGEFSVFSTMSGPLANQ